MNYRTVKCSDRLPDTIDAYYVNCGKHGLYAAYYDPEDDKWSYLPWGWEVEFWLEPYELPTEEEIVEILKAHQSYMGSEVQIVMGDCVPDWEYESVAKAITNLLKGQE